jgi:3-dehydroquinate dehydratase
MRTLLLNGPTLASLGRRQLEMYGTPTLAEVEEACQPHALKRGSLRAGG